MKKALILLTILITYPVFAQDMSYLQDQIDSLKEEMVILNRQVYRSRTDSAVSVSQSGAATLGEYDEIIRSLNGKVEELEFKLKQMEERLNTMNSDFETRFRMLEGKPIAAGAGALSTPQKHAPSVAKGAPKSIIGDTVTSSSLQNLPGNTESVESIYKKGLEALQSNDTTAATQHFLLILEDYPNDKLASNAQYWLGETYYKEKKYDKAAVAFGKGFEKYKNGNKGADCLYKLGLSMKELGKKTEACAALKNLPIEFPKAEQSLKDKAKSQAVKFGCK